VIAVLAFHPGKAVSQHAAIQESADDFAEIGTEETIGAFKSLFVALQELGKHLKCKGAERALLAAHDRLPEQIRYSTSTELVSTDSESGLAGAAVVVPPARRHPAGVGRSDRPSPIFH
jgi:hypothetical protein